MDLTFYFAKIIVGLAISGFSFVPGSGYLTDLFANIGGDYTCSMRQGAARCSDWSWWEPIYQPDAGACSDYCVNHGADACEWNSVTGECFVEFGGNCYIDANYTDWQSAVCGSSSPSPHLLPVPSPVPTSTPIPTPTPTPTPTASLTPVPDLVYKISGTVLYDENSNGLRDAEENKWLSSSGYNCANEVPVPGLKVKLSYPQVPGGIESIEVLVNICGNQSSGKYAGEGVYFETPAFPKDTAVTIQVIIPDGWKSTWPDTVTYEVKSEYFVGFALTKVVSASAPTPTPHFFERENTWTERLREWIGINEDHVNVPTQTQTQTLIPTLNSTLAPQPILTPTQTSSPSPTFSPESIQTTTPTTVSEPTLKLEEEISEDGILKSLFDERNIDILIGKAIAAGFYVDNSRYDIHSGGIIRIIDENGHVVLTISEIIDRAAPDGFEVNRSGPHLKFKNIFADMVSRISNLAFLKTNLAGAIVKGFGVFPPGKGPVYCEAESGGATTISMNPNTGDPIALFGDTLSVRTIGEGLEFVYQANNQFNIGTFGTGAPRFRLLDENSAAYADVVIIIYPDEDAVMSTIKTGDKAYIYVSQRYLQEYDQATLIDAMVHEFGHVVGLGHTTTPNSTMWPYSGSRLAGFFSGEELETLRRIHDKNARYLVNGSDCKTQNEQKAGLNLKKEPEATPSPIPTSSPSAEASPTEAPAEAEPSPEPEETEEGFTDEVSVDPCEVSYCDFYYGVPDSTFICVMTTTICWDETDFGGLFTGEAKAQNFQSGVICTPGRVVCI